MASTAKAVVESLYEALLRGDAAAAAGLLAEDVEWWFHGPRRCQYMRRTLTGEAGPRDFRFRPRRVAEVGRWVVAEGWEGKHAYWVHAWAVDVATARIIRFREYFNTSVTVQEVAQPSEAGISSGGGVGGSAVWRSQAGPNAGGRSLPGLVLAI
ncbi:uncharacterized protein LOC121999176 [Zingiber officinale]|uniref:Wound-induced protein 1 n=1 Tax=Zingiber officinale TaxID=94328 RepID=A0A8J5HTW4_ZINOF|nr:uncharacterized protein LOC121999176 [Zingiber officinale]KAG6535327.1 hypothetical protein ZIOFF_000292 [Zingiber officinale]